RNKNMSASASNTTLIPDASPQLRTRNEPAAEHSYSASPDYGAVRVNLLVRWAFYLSVFMIPFTKLYLPGTGERIGVARLVQVLILCAAISQPRVCLRLVPVALFWFLAYCGVRIVSGLWLTPELSATWWPGTLEWIEFSLPWLWVMFNVLQFPEARRGGL